MPPVLSLGFSLPRRRGATVPLTPTTNSLRSSLPRGLKLLAGVGLEDDLGHSVTVAQVDEDQPAEVAIAIDPAVQDDWFARRRRWSIRRTYVFFSVAWNQCEVRVSGFRQQQVNRDWKNVENFVPWTDVASR